MTCSPVEMKSCPIRWQNIRDEGTEQGCERALTEKLKELSRARKVAW